MSNFKPEGQLISEKSNKEFLSSLSSLKEAYHLDAVLESRVLLCDRDHNLKVDLGCTYGQGYLYAKPMKQEEFEEFMEKHLA